MNFVLKIKLWTSNNHLNSYFDAYRQLPPDMAAFSDIIGLEFNSTGYFKYVFPSPIKGIKNHAFLSINTTTGSLAIATNPKANSYNSDFELLNNNSLQYINNSEGNVFYLNIITNRTKTSSTTSQSWSFYKRYTALGKFQVQASLKCNTVMSRNFTVTILDGKLLRV